VKVLLIKQDYKTNKQRTNKRSYLLIRICH